MCPVEPPSAPGCRSRLAESARPAHPSAPVRSGARIVRHGVRVGSARTQALKVVRQRAMPAAYGETEACPAPRGSVKREWAMPQGLGQVRRYGRCTSGQWTSCPARCWTGACNAACEVVLKLKPAWHDGSAHLVMSPLLFMQRVAAPVTRGTAQAHSQRVRGAQSDVRGEAARAKCSRSRSDAAQGTFCEIQISRVGGTSAGSSSVAVVNSISSGLSSCRYDNWVPQRTQKPRLTCGEERKLAR